ncbi:MAG: ACT domain-containing protein [Clostridia bacterium]|nr:ACT domain-containing protein [Clostridia bacterium]
MAIRQLSVFLENKKGSLSEITNLLAEAKVDLRSMCIAETSNYGIVRIIANDPAKALEILIASGFAAQIRPVTAFAVPDQPGGLAQVLEILEENGINIEYMYALVTTIADKAYAVMRTDDEEKTEAVLAKNNIELLDEKNV